MTSFPVPLDNLITYVESLHPSGDALENLADAVAVGTRLDEHSDADRSLRRPGPPVRSLVEPDRHQHGRVDLLTEPAGLAARIVHDTGVTHEQLYAAFDLAAPADRGPPIRLTCASCVSATAPRRRCRAP